MRAVTAGAMRDVYFECVVECDIACSIFDFDDDDDDDDDEG